MRSTYENIACLRALRLAAAVLAAAMSCFFAACDDASFPVPSTPLVVDGWIDAGGAPVVLLSKSISPTESMQDSSALMAKVVSYARVFVSDGSRRVELDGRRDDRYFPPYVYTTDEMLGEAGKTYRLEVDYPGIKAWAETSVPAPAAIDSFVVRVSERTDSLFTLSACFTDDPSTRDYYKFFTMTSDQGQAWNSSFLGLVDDSVIPFQELEVPVARGWGLLEKYRQPLFRKGERLRVKFCTIDKVSYDYWKSYDDIAALARNAFFPVSENTASNLHGALGSWCGYGAVFYDITIDSQ